MLNSPLVILKDRLLLQRNMVHMDVVLVKMVVWLQTYQGKFWVAWFILFSKLLILVHYICSFKEALDLVQEAIGRTGYNEKIKIAIDAAATEFCIGNVLLSVQASLQMIFWESLFVWMIYITLVNILSM